LNHPALTLAAEAANGKSAFTTEANARTKAAEMAISSAKTAALADIRNMAGEAARQLVTRLAGAEPAAAEVTSALAAAERDSR
jgi:hypothetical protein